LAVLEQEGADGVVDAVWQSVRDHGATLLVIDGASVPAGFDAGPFVHRLQTRSAMLGCTTVLLAGSDDGTRAAGHVDGVIELTNEPAGSRDARWLRVAKLRGSSYLSGRHRFAIGSTGVAVFPRLEAARADLEPAFADSRQRVPVGVPGLDAMLSGGLPSASSTLLLGTPGAGKTLLGLHFLAEGARRGEPGLIAAFNETGPALAATAERAGLELRSHMESGLVRVLWRPPLERSPDEWAWQLLAAIDEHKPKRLVVDAFTDLARLFVIPERQTRFASALANELRNRQVTTVFAMEIDAFAGPELAAPIPNISATMDNGILLRSAEVESELRRLVSVLKLRMSPFDQAIRGFTIGDGGIHVGDRVAATGLLTGTAVPDREVE
jgi:circadian clock protein KaiC